MPTLFWKSLLKCLPTTTLSSSSSSPFPHEDDETNSIRRRTGATPPTPTIETLTKYSTSDDHHQYYYSSKQYLSSSANSSLLFSSTSISSSSSSSSVSDPDTPVDFAAISASHRFFFSSPGRSKSITESSDSTTILPPLLLSPNSPLTGGVAVKKYSPDPYEDFKRSMQEMVEARRLKGGRDDVVDWEYLHELLSCYLRLNPKNAHKFIISAFADITITLLASSPPESGNDRPELRHRHRHNQEASPPCLC